VTRVHTVNLDLHAETSSLDKSSRNFRKRPALPAQISISMGLSTNMVKWVYCSLLED
jgi:hypothetical protein